MNGSPPTKRLAPKALLLAYLALGCSACGGSDDAATSNDRSSGCGQESTIGVTNRSIDVGGVERTYVLSVPFAYDPDTPLPVVFVWHGRTDSGAIARGYLGIEEAANENAIFVYPDGLPIEDGDTAWDVTPDGTDVAFFDNLVATLSAEYCVATRRVFAAGVSFGGYFTHRLGCSRADVLRAIAPVASGLPWPLGTCSNGIAAWMAHGESDEVVTFADGETARDRWVANDGCTDISRPTEPPPCVAYQGCTVGQPVHWCAYEGGHVWPDFAAEAIWQFFAR